MIILKDITTSPGCYLYKDKNGKIIYIGKAKNLQKRVKSYFQKTDHDPKTSVLVKNIKDVEIIATNTEVEALILENTLIKKHRPKFNIDLKDSKRYSYIKITEDDFPRVIIWRRSNKGKNVFGPFVSGGERNHILTFLRKTFKLRTCKRMPKRACLRYHINLCTAPCINNISKTEYNKKIRKVKQVLKGNTKDLIKNMKIEIKKESEDLQFEHALELRDQVYALEYLNEKQQMERSKSFDEDIINYIVKDDKVYMMLFNVYRGTLTNRSDFVFDYNNDFFEEFLIQYYSEHDIPKELILPTKVTDSLIDFLNHELEKRINRKTKHKIVQITYPKIGDKKILLKLVKKNIELTFFENQNILEELQKKLRLNFKPEVIECFDISHLSGTSTVGSMVQFRSGRPDKSNYRRFKIRTVDQIDDFASMAEVVRRRYKRLRDEKQEMPDLIIIDGGKGQLSKALEELQALNLKIPIISIAKRFEEIYVPGRKFPIRLAVKDKALLYMRQIRDEAHRFAITYNKLLRKKKLLEKQ